MEAEDKKTTKIGKAKQATTKTLTTIADNDYLPTSPKPEPQDHMGLTGVLINVVTRLHTVEAL